MDSQRWKRVEEIFHQALGRNGSELEAWLEEACADDTELRAEVLSLLHSDRVAAGFVGSKVEQAVIELGADAQAPVEGRRVGPYRLIRELGRGGMGAVYLAARDDHEYESEVALKVVRPGLDTDFILRRFRRERQILARLQHPNIARLLDGGTTEDGVPYLVMEYVQGSWITRYAASKKLSIDERLRLFLPVCAAVEHAHRNFIVHRDLKPGNILIDQDGIPKLLDFGISKLLHSDQPDAETQGIGMMTPDYASPEQIMGDPVTVMSDVYSLGAVLYELLSGARPHRIDRRTPLALERAICLDDLILPSVSARDDRSIARQLAGDLDNIILHAMQKEPERRYQSVEQMAEDLRRYLEHRPVRARPDSVVYRASRFVRRNRVAVAFGALVAASLIGGGLVSIRQARIAQERFDQVRKLATTFVFDIEQAARDLPGSLGLRQKIAHTGLEYLDNLSRSSANDRDLRRELALAYMRIGDLQGGVDAANLGQPGAAVESYGRAQVLLDSVVNQSPSERKILLDQMTLMHRIGNVHRQVGQLKLSAEALEKGLRTAEALLAAQPGDSEVAQYGAVFYLDLGRLHQLGGDLGRAADDVNRGINLLKQVVAARPDDRETRSNIAASHARLGAVLAELGRREEALASYRAGVAELEEITRRFPSEIRPRHQLMLAYSHVGDTLGNPAYDHFGDAAGALAAYRKMLEIASALHKADPNDMRAASDYGIALLRVGIVMPPEQQEEKRATLKKAYDVLDRVDKSNPKDRPNAIHKAWAAVELGDVAVKAGDRHSGSGYYRTAMATADTVQVLDPTDTSSQRWLVVAARKLAEEQTRFGDRNAALSNVDRIVELGKRADSATAPASLNARSVVPRAWHAAGSVYATLAKHEKGKLREQDLKSASDWHRRAVEEWRKMASRQGFLTTYRNELKAAEEALASVDSSLAQRNAQ